MSFIVFIALHCLYCPSVPSTSFSALQCRRQNYELCELVFIKKFHFGSHQNSVPIAVCHSVAVCDKHPSTYISGPIAPKANCLYSFLFFQKYFPNMTAPEPLGLWTYFRTPKSERQNVARAPRNRSWKKRPRKPSDLEIATIGRSPICRAG